MGPSILRLCAGIVVVASLTACDSGKGDSPAKQDVGTKSMTCVPESDLNGIVGGSLVNEDDSDAHMVMMLNIISDDGHLEICTATAIAPDVLLTAAHCASGATADHAFITLYHSITCESGFDIHRNIARISSFVVNEQFDPALVNGSSVDQIVGDVALIFLQESLPSYYPIHKIAHVADIPSTSPLYLLGYGSTSAVITDKGTSGPGAGTLRRAQLPFSDVTIDATNKKVNIDQSAGEGICTGDSGGPGFVEVNGEFEILGVNSYVGGPNDNICTGQATMTLADSYRDWIEQKMQLFGRSLAQ